MTNSEEMLVQWDRVRDNFDWSTCAECFARMGWTYALLDRPPTAREIKDNAGELFDLALKEWIKTKMPIVVSSGRLTVVVSGITVSITFAPMYSERSWVSGGWE